MPTAVPRPLTLDAVDRIQVRGSAAGKGALVGAAIGAVGGIVAGVALANWCGPLGGDCTPNYGAVVPIVAVVSTAGGALLGAIVGAPFKRWKTVYRTPH